MPLSFIFGLPAGVPLESGISPSRLWKPQALCEGASAFVQRNKEAKRFDFNRKGFRGRNVLKGASFKLCRGKYVAGDGVVVALNFDISKIWKREDEETDGVCRELREEQIADVDDVVKSLMKEGVLKVLEDTEKNIQYFIIGTCHVSKKSALQVRQLISTVRPTAVMVELCPSRAFNVLLSTEAEAAEMRKVSPGAVFDAMKEDGLPGILGVTLVLVHNMLSTRMNSRPGGEFVAAAEEAARLNSTLILGDRPVDVTLARLAKYAQRVGLPLLIVLEAVGLLLDHVVNAIFGPFIDLGPLLFNSNLPPPEAAAAVGVGVGVGAEAAPGAMDQVLSALSTTFSGLLVDVATLPFVVAGALVLASTVINQGLIERILAAGMMSRVPLPPLVEERDLFMVHSMTQHPLAPRARGDTLVAVVGAAHVPGMVRTMVRGLKIDPWPLIEDAGGSEWTRERAESEDRRAHEELRRRLQYKD